MNRRFFKSIIWGFLNGTVGAYILGALALVFDPFGFVARILLAPARVITDLITGSQSNTFKAWLLLLFNGIFCIILFTFISQLFTRKSEQKE